MAIPGNKIIISEDFSYQKDGEMYLFHKDEKYNVEYIFYHDGVQAGVVPMIYGEVVIVEKNLHMNYRMFDMLFRDFIKKDYGHES